MDYVNLVFSEMLGELETNVQGSEVQEFSLLEMALALSGSQKQSRSSHSKSN